VIPRDLAAFLQEGVGIYIGTRNQQLEPNGARAIAATVDPDGSHFVVFLAEIAARRVLPDLESNGHAAVTFGRPIDERAVQVKGTFTGVRPAEESERALLDAQWNGFSRSLAQIGIPPEGREAWILWPAVAVRLKATAIFDQTPGPSAGTPLA